MTNDSARGRQGRQPGQQPGQGAQTTGGRPGEENLDGRGRKAEGTHGQPRIERHGDKADR